MPGVYSYLEKQLYCISLCCSTVDCTCINKVIPLTSQFLVILDPNPKATPKIPVPVPKERSTRQEKGGKIQRNAPTTISGASFHSKWLQELPGGHLDTLRSQTDMNRIPISIRNRTNNHIIAVFHNVIFHISALALASTLPCVQVFLISTCQGRLK